MRAFSLFCLNCFILSRAGETPYIRDPHSTPRNTQSSARSSNASSSPLPTQSLRTTASSICLSPPFPLSATQAPSSSSSSRPSTTV
jgi:hypothetical protein